MHYYFNALRAVHIQYIFKTFKYVFSIDFIGLNDFSTESIHPCLLGSQLQCHLTEFHDKIEASQKKMRVGMVSEIRDIMTSEVLTPLKESIAQANKKIEDIESDHIQRINANTANIDRTRAELEQRITRLHTQISSSTPISKPQPQIIPSILGRLNNCDNRDEGTRK